MDGISPFGADGGGTDMLGGICRFSTATGEGKLRGGRFPGE
jgi:hypothetical protein